MLEVAEIIACNDDMYFDENKQKIKYLSNFSKINIFVGANNCGKSRMMRLLFDSNVTKILSNDCEESEESRFQGIKNDIIRNLYKLNDKNEFIDVEKTKLYSNLDFFVNTYKKIDQIAENEDFKIYPYNNYIRDIYQDLYSLLRILAKEGAKPSVPIRDREPIYIPILRGIENFNLYFKSDDKIIETISMTQKQRDSLENYKNNSKNIYHNKIVRDYNLGGEVFTAEFLYEDIVNKLLGEEEGRNFIRDFENFISKEFYDNKEFRIIPQIQKGYLEVKIGEAERELFNLGDGIKQLIAILYKIYEHKDEGKIFFIEEPELNLHPGFQRRLLEILQLKEFDKNQYFITTHSNHFIDSCLDYSNISIYKFINMDDSNKRFQIINTSPKDISLLDELGVSNSSVFIANCTIWVEGISDKIYLKKYLEKYFEKHNMNKYIEDIHYAFVEYGGNNITHWSFIDDENIDTINSSGITNRSCIVLDNDNDRKEERKEKLKALFNDRYFELEVREMENTISKNVLEKTLFNGNEIKYKNKECSDESKFQNKKTYMGNFIENTYDIRKKYTSNGGSGTIANKLNFSKNIVKNIENYDDLSNEAKRITEKIAQFIIKSNENL